MVIARATYCGWLTRIGPSERPISSRCLLFFFRLVRRRRLVLEGAGSARDAYLASEPSVVVTRCDAAPLQRLPLPLHQTEKSAADKNVKHSAAITLDRSALLSGNESQLGKLRPEVCLMAPDPKSADAEWIQAKPIKPIKTLQHS